MPPGWRRLASGRPALSLAMLLDHSLHMRPRRLALWCGLHRCLPDSTLVFRLKTGEWADLTLIDWQNGAHGRHFQRLDHLRRRHQPLTIAPIHIPPLAQVLLEGPIVPAVELAIPNGHEVLPDLQKGLQARRNPAFTGL